MILRARERKLNHRKEKMEEEWGPPTEIFEGKWLALPRGPERLGKDTVYDLAFRLFSPWAEPEQLYQPLLKLMWDELLLV